MKSQFLSGQFPESRSESRSGPGPCPRLLLLLAIGLFPLVGASAEPLNWLYQSIDPTRPHSISVYSAWHARILVLAWGILLPLGAVFARYFKIWPGQDWPLELDRQEWWHAHLYLQVSGAALSFAGVALLVYYSNHSHSTDTFNHRLFGWLTMALLTVQLTGGLLRGSKGGPTEPVTDGDHYNMTQRRKVFEYIHKSTGYLALLCGCSTIVLGLWAVNAPNWMWVTITLWWLALVVAVFVLQRKGHSVDTYQAIWGPGPEHPGNHVKPIGIGVNRRRSEGRRPEVGQ